MLYANIFGVQRGFLGGFFPGGAFQLGPLVTIEDIDVSSAPTARILEALLDDQLSCNANNTSVA